MPPEPIVLAFDTSAAHCAAALLLPDGTCHVRVDLMERGQAEALMPLLEGLLAEAGLGWRDLAALAVGTGPGNFTGVRIAVAAARGLALGLRIPALGITQMEARAYGLPRPLAVAEDARRGEVYLQRFTPDAQPARLVPLDQAAGIVGPGLALTGSAADALAALTGAPVLAGACPPVQAMAHLAAQRLAQGTTPHPRPAPFYLRAADAAPPADPPPVILPVAPAP